MNKGDTLVSTTTNSIWDITEGEELQATSNEYFYNGEFHIITNKGDIPSVFLKTKELQP